MGAASGIAGGAAGARGAVGAYSTWPAEAEVGQPKQGWFRGMLLDDVGEWWTCQHQHASGSDATRCAREQLTVIG